MSPYREVLAELTKAGVRFLVIGVTGINFYATRKHLLFNTEDCDLFLPLDPENLVTCWRVLESRGFEMTSHGEPLEKPLDRWLAERVIESRAVVRVLGPHELRIDLTPIMMGQYFENLWNQRRTFEVEGQQIPVASLTTIVESKRAAKRDKDLLFFVTHEEILKELLDELTWSAEGRQ